MSKKIFSNASQTRRLPVGTVLVEADGALIYKESGASWREFFMEDDGVEIGSFRAREISFPARKVPKLKHVKL